MHRTSGAYAAVDPLFDCYANLSSGFIRPHRASIYSFIISIDVTSATFLRSSTHTVQPEFRICRIRGRVVCLSGPAARVLLIMRSNFNAKIDRYCL